MEQLTDYAEPVSGFYLPDGRILVEIDEAGNERTQLHILGEGALVSDPRFNHWTPHASKDGRRLAYSTNRRNGRDFDIVVRELASGEERKFEMHGYVMVDSISADGRWVVAVRGNELAGDTDLLLIDVDAGGVEHVTPHGARPSSAGQCGMVTASTRRRTTAGTRPQSRASTSARARGCPSASRAGISSASAPPARLVVVANEDGYSRSDDLPFPGDGVADHFVFSPDGTKVAFGFSTTTEPQQVWLPRLRRRASRAGSRPRPRRGGVEPTSTASRASTASRSGLPLRRRRRRPVPVVVTIHGGPERSGCRGTRPASARSRSTSSRAATRSRRRTSAARSGYGKRFRASTTWRSASTRSRPRSLHAWLAGRPEIDGDRQCLRPLVRRLHGPRRPSFPTRAMGGGARCVGISSLRTSSRTRRITAAPCASASTARSPTPSCSTASRRGAALDAIRAPLFIEHGRNDPRVPVSESEAIHAARRTRGRA